MRNPSQSQTASPIIQLAGLQGAAREHALETLQVSSRSIMLRIAVFVLKAFIC